MSKKVMWPDGKYNSEVRPGHYRSLGEMLDKANTIREEQERAQEYLKKAFIPMVKLLEIRLSKGMPLYVMRPLRYMTSMLSSELKKADPIEDSFYNSSKSSRVDADKFVDVAKVINPGTQLILKGLDPQMREFLFTDAVGNEHPISYDDRDKLLTQTDVFETVKQYLETKGDK